MSHTCSSESTIIGVQFPAGFQHLVSNSLQLCRLICVVILNNIHFILRRWTQIQSSWSNFRPFHQREPFHSIGRYQRLTMHLHKNCHTPLTCLIYKLYFTHSKNPIPFYTNNLVSLFGLYTKLLPESLEANFKIHFPWKRLHSILCKKVHFTWSCSLIVMH